MNTITKYVAYTGKEFTDPVACEKYEERATKADFIISQFPKIPDLPSCSFENGGGYIQHDKVLVLKVRRELLQLAANEFDHEFITQSLEDDSIDPSWAGRVISQGCNGQLWNAWNRICCIDKEYREWGQPYFTNNPNEGKQIQLN